MKDKALWNEIKYLVIDVDGTMTDAGIYYDEHGNELKKFCTKDAAGYAAAHKAGIKLMVLTGRECEATTRRMKEMNFDYIVQKIKDKSTYLKKFMEENNISRQQIGYIGDDLNDLSSMKICGFVGCPNDACDEVKALSNYVSEIKGGYGAVRDIISFLLKGRNEWNSIISEIYETGI